MGEIGAGNGTGYPAALDTNNSLEQNDNESNPTLARAEVVNDLAAGLLAVQTELGLDPAGSFATVLLRLNSLKTTTSAESSDFTVVATDVNKYILVTASTVAVTGTLLAAATAGDGFRVRIMKMDATNWAVRVDGDGSETINGVLTIDLFAQYSFVDLLSNGSEWVVVGSRYFD